MADIKLFSAKIIGTGHYVPENILTNKYLSEKLELSEDWIFSRCGINNRRICSENENTSDLALKASESALLSANISASEIDLIIFCTTTPDKLCPSTASKLQSELNTINASGFDLNSACAGFIYGFSVAYQFIATGMYKTVLIVGSEAMSKTIDDSDKSTSILFGDGAGAVILQRSEEEKFINFSLGLDGSKRDLIDMNFKKDELYPKLRMIGKSVFKWSLSFLPSFILDTLKKSNLSLDDIDYFIFHQANKRIIDSVISKLEIPENKVLTNIEDYGNTSSASIPIILSESLEKEIIKKNDKLFLIGFGAGISWGACILEF